MSERALPSIEIKSFTALNPDKTLINGQRVNLSPAKVEEMVEVAKLMQCESCHILEGVCLCYTSDKEAESAVGKLETSLRKNKLRIPPEQVRDALNAEVTLPQDITGTIGSILEDGERTLTAIESATEVFRSYYEGISNYSSEQLEERLEEKEASVVASLEVYLRSNQGRYNGSTKYFKPVAALNVAQYLKSADVIEGSIPENLKSPTIADRGVIYTYKSS